MPGGFLLPGARPRQPGDAVSGPASDGVRYSPAQLARLLGLPEPTTEQAAVIGAPLCPMVVAAGAGSGKSETMAARVVWLVANGLVRPERVLGLTFTRKAAAELSERVRRRLDGLRAVGLNWGAASTGAASTGAASTGAASTRRGEHGRGEHRRGEHGRGEHWRRGRGRRGHNWPGQERRRDRFLARRRHGRSARW